MPQLNGHVLVIDDEQEWLESHRRALGRKGFLVSTALSGREGLAVVATERPDAVLVDLRMPEMDGLQVMEAVHRLDPQLPIILMTAYLSVEAAAAVKECLYYDYIPKPFTMERLELALRRAVGHRHFIEKGSELQGPNKADEARSA